MDPMTIAMLASAAGKVIAPITQGIGTDLATPTGAATSGQNVFDFGNWTVSTGSSRADATNTKTTPASISAGGMLGGGGIDMNMILIGLVVVVIMKKVVR